MVKIAVVTDSISNIPRDLVEEWGIHIVPIQLHWDGRSYRDSINLTAGDVYRRLRQSRTLPTTSAPSVGDFVTMYTQLSEQYECIVSLHVASDLSATYQAARVAAEVTETLIPVHVVDTGTAAMGQGFSVLAAARAAAEGAGLEKIIQAAEQVIERVLVYAMLDTLEYLRRSGRVERAVSAASSLLSIKPILSINGRGVELMAKPRTRARAHQVLVEAMRQRVKRQPVHVAVMHADALEEAEDIRQQVADEMDCAELFITEFTPVMGCMTGPGLVGLAFYSDADGQN